MALKHEIGRVLGSREDGMEYWNKYNEIVKEVIDSEECKPGIAEFVKTSSALSESALLLVLAAHDPESGESISEAMSEAIKKICEGVFLSGLASGITGTISAIQKEELAL